MDHIVKPVVFAALSVHWFNPLVWIAFSLFCKDMEMSCDEAVVSKMGEHIRADYAESLLALSTRHRILQWIPVDFGEGDTKGRIRNLAAFRKTKKGVLAILVAGAVLLIVCLASTRGVAVSEAYGTEEKNISTSDANTSTDENVGMSGDGSDSLIPAQTVVSPDPANFIIPMWEIRTIFIISTKTLYYGETAVTIADSWDKVHRIRSSTVTK